MSRRPLLAELRRRNVPRAAALYAATAWLLVQIVTQVLPVFSAPAWTMRWVIIALMIGFPFWLAFAWFFELTPQGFRRERKIAPGESITHHTGKKLDRWIIAVLALAVVLLLTDRFVLRNSATDASTGSTVSAKPVSARSIAVLPFENLSADADNAYFVAGMQDEILTRLSNIGDLQVISRTSAGQYKSRPADVRTVGKELGVANIVEGSVQRADDRVRITVQLIDAVTDTHLWAQSYDRELSDVFAVQSDVAERIADALKLTLLPAETAALTRRPTEDTAAYDLFLRAEYLFNVARMTYDSAGMKSAIPLYQQAVAKDPGFALAWARLSVAQGALAWFGGADVDARQLGISARADAQRALTLQPELAEAHLAMGYSHYWGQQAHEQALQSFAEALRLRPNYADAFAARAFILRRQGRYDEAIQQLQKALALDPRNSQLAFELAATQTIARHYADAEASYRRALELDPDNVNAKTFYATNVFARDGDLVRALSLLQGDDPQLMMARANVLEMQRRYPEAIALFERIADTPDTFDVATGPKSLYLGRLYREAGDATRARAMFMEARAALHAQLDAQTVSPSNLPFIWAALADAELGLGHVEAAMQASDKSLATSGQDRLYRNVMNHFAAILHADAGHADRAVPLLERVLADPGSGHLASPAMLRLEPYWDPIREDPRFQALLKRYPVESPPTASH